MLETEEQAGSWRKMASKRSRFPVADDARLDDLRAGLSDAQTVLAIQHATTRAMRLAVAGISKDDGRAQSLSERCAPAHARSRDLRSHDVRLRAAEVALQARRDDVAPLPPKAVEDGGSRARGPGAFSVR